MTGVFCEICGQLDDRCNVYAHRMADRIAQLEAAVAKLSAAAETMPVGAQGSGGATTEPTATPAAARSIPPGYKLAPGWRVEPSSSGCLYNDGEIHDHFWRGGMSRCPSKEHAVGIGALVKVDPPAEQPTYDWSNVDRECVCGHGRASHTVANPNVASWPQWCGADGCGCQVHRPTPAEQPVSAADELPGYETTDGCIFCRKRVQDPDEEKCIHCRPAPAHGAPDSNHCPKHPLSMVRAEKTYPGGTVVPALPCEECTLDHRSEAERVRKVMLDACASAIASKQAAQGAPADSVPDSSSPELLQKVYEVTVDALAETRRKLAAAERERDEAIKANAGLVTFAKMYEEQRDEALRALDLAHTTAGLDRLQAEANERERCLYHIETYEPRRDVPADWSHEGALTRIAKVIRDGEPSK